MKVQIDQYFLEEVCPFTKRRKVKWKNVRFLSIGLLILGVSALLFFGPDGEKLTQSPQDGNSPQGQTPNENNQTRHSDDPFSSPYSSPSKPARQYSASQLVKRGDGMSGDNLPMGTTIPARLVNTVLSSDSNSPVIAEITEDIFWKNGLMIPASTKAIGQGTLDDTIERLQARFHTLVFPEGTQHSIAALALLPDGSSGLAGDYHSRALAKQGGRFFGNFVGGLAQGLKDKDTRGQAGIVFEPGSLKNGVLNGVATSSLDQARYFAESTEQLRPFLEVPGGTSFLLYFEREFSP